MRTTRYGKSRTIGEFYRNFDEFYSFIFTFFDSPSGGVYTHPGSFLVRINHSTTVDDDNNNSDSNAVRLRLGTTIGRGDLWARDHRLQSLHIYNASTNVLSSDIVFFYFVRETLFACDSRNFLCRDKPSDRKNDNSI